MSKISTFLSSILKNPITEYLRFLVNWWKNQFKYNNFYQDYMALVTNSTISHNVSVSSRVAIEDSVIGSYTYVRDNTRIFNGVVGNFCSIGPNCIIRLGVHPVGNFVSSHPIFYSPKMLVGTTFVDHKYFEEEEKTVHIGNDVWIGSNVIVVDGVTIGDGAIIAAGAVVTKDVPPYAICGGIPAKLIRYRFDEQKIDFLLKFKWWDKDEKWLRKNVKDFHNIDKFIHIYNTKNS
jgi:acetyltransferase-like isoleucine patch superfamily enzyme